MKENFSKRVQRIIKQSKATECGSQNNGLYKTVKSIYVIGFRETSTF